MKDIFCKTWNNSPILNNFSYKLMNCLQKLTLDKYDIASMYELCIIVILWMTSVRSLLCFVVIFEKKTFSTTLRLKVQQNCLSNSIVRQY